MHSYIAPTWCEICHNFLWGLKQQGMQCKDCGMDIHKQCLPLAIQLQCYPTKAFVKRGVCVCVAWNVRVYQFSQYKQRL